MLPFPICVHLHVIRLTFCSLLTLYCTVRQFYLHTVGIRFVAYYWDFHHTYTDTHTQTSFPPYFHRYYYHYIALYLYHHHFSFAALRTHGSGTTHTCSFRACLLLFLPPPPWDHAHLLPACVKYLLPTPITGACTFCHLPTFLVYHLPLDNFIPPFLFVVPAYHTACTCTVRATLHYFPCGWMNAYRLCRSYAFIGGATCCHWHAHVLPAAAQTDFPRRTHSAAALRLHYAIPPPTRRCAACCLPAGCYALPACRLLLPPRTAFRLVCYRYVSLLRVLHTAWITTLFTPPHALLPRTRRTVSARRCFCVSCISCRSGHTTWFSSNAHILPACMEPLPCRFCATFYLHTHLLPFCLFHFYHLFVYFSHTSLPVSLSIYLLHTQCLVHTAHTHTHVLTAHTCPFTHILPCFPHSISTHFCVLEETYFIYCTFYSACTHTFLFLFILQGWFSSCLCLLSSCCLYSIYLSLLLSNTPLFFLLPACPYP